MLHIILQLIIFALLNSVKALNILVVFPTPSTSPEYMFTTLIEEIANHGHEITLVTAKQAFTKGQAIENITTIDMHYKLNTIWQRYNKIIMSDQNRDTISELSLTLQTTNSFYEEMLQTDEFRKLINEKGSNFDLMLFEATMIPLLSFSHLFKAPAILVSSSSAVLNNYEIIGAPTHPFLYPSIFQRRIYNLTLFEKVIQTSTYIRLKSKILSYEKKVDLMQKKYFGYDFPTLNYLRKKVFALFLNSNPIWEGNRPVSSNVVFMGGIQPRNMEELPQDLQSFLDKSRNGFIYVSFGSNIKPSQLSPKKLLTIINVLSEISYDVVLKWDNNRLPRVPKNIKVYNWLPQSSLLVHPKIKLFITQGGIQSTFEAINAGVPLIGIPMYSDQWYNTEKYRHFHIGLQMDLASLTERKLLNAIHLVIHDKSYRNSIADLRALMFEQPEASLERAIWWMEQVLRPDGIRHLSSPAANMSWAEYLELDFIFFILLVTFLIILVLIVSITLIIHYTIGSIGDMRKKIR